MPSRKQSDKKHAEHARYSPQGVALFHFRDPVSREELEKQAAVPSTRLPP